jgi:hypothetical protein
VRYELPGLRGNEDPAMHNVLRKNAEWTSMNSGYP